MGIVLPFRRPQRGQADWPVVLFLAASLVAGVLFWAQILRIISDGFR